MAIRTLAELFRQHLTGPRWEVTRDVLAQHPDALEEIIDSIDEDLQLLIDQLASESAMTDVRITVEHLVLLLGRAFPLINSVVADLYMTQVADIERAASEVLPQRILDTSAQFRSLQDGLRKSELPRDADRREQITIILDSAAAMAAIHLTCLTVLRELIGTPV